MIPAPTVRHGNPDRLSESVIEAIAAAKGVDPMALTLPLFTAIETDALDRLFRTPDGRVAFTYDDCRVTVEADGLIEVAPTRRDAVAPAADPNPAR